MPSGVEASRLSGKLKEAEAILHQANASLSMTFACRFQDFLNNPLTRPLIARIHFQILHHLPHQFFGRGLNV